MSLYTKSRCMQCYYVPETIAKETFISVNRLCLNRSYKNTIRPQFLLTNEIVTIYLSSTTIQTHPSI